MTGAGEDPDELPQKLVKRLAILKAAGGVGPWSEAGKQYRQLEERGLITKGNMQGQEFAVLPEMVPKGENDG